MRKGCAFVVAVVAGLGFLFQSPQTVLANDAVHALKVDIAGRQRMLTQRIAKAGCFLATFQDIEKHRVMLADARALFAKSLNALKHGDPAMSLPAETNALILKELNRVDQPWETLDFAGGLLLDSYQFPGLDVNLLMENNLPALKQSNIVVQVMDTVYSKVGTKKGGLVTTVNIAGRQRMLTQKAAKEFCWIGYGLQADRNREELRRTVELFDLSLGDLMQGSGLRAIMAAPTDEIAAKLSAIQATWKEARDVYLKIADGAFPSTEDFRLVSRRNDLLLKESNAVVQLLVAYGKAQANTAAGS